MKHNPKSFPITTNIKLKNMDLKDEINRHRSECGVIYKMNAQQELVLTDGRSCTVPDYEVIPETTCIKERAFSTCTQIRSVDMSKSQVGTIGDAAFFACKNLKAVHFSECLQSIGSFAFESCSLEELDFPDNLKTIDIGTFSLNKELKEVIIPHGVTEIHNIAFQSCPKLSQITLLSPTAYIGKHAFRYCDAIEVVYVSWKDENRIKCILPQDMKEKVEAFPRIG